VLGDIGAGLLAAMWLSAVATKVGDLDAMKRAVELAVGRRLASIGPVVLLLEFGLAVALLTPEVTVATIGLQLSSGALVVLGAFAVMHAKRAPGESCACFGPGSTTSGAKHLAFNIAAATASALMSAFWMPSSDLPERLIGLFLGLGIAVLLLVMRPIWQDVRRAVV
jgi:hypothetical protein